MTELHQKFFGLKIVSLSYIVSSWLELNRCENKIGKHGTVLLSLPYKATPPAKLYESF